jgi:hypothetical protein
LESDRAARRVHLVARHIGEVGEEKVEVCWVAWSARGEEWFGKIAVKEGDARSNTSAQCIGARNSERLAREIGCGESKRRWRLRCNGDSDRTAPRADLRRVQWLRCATERARRRYTISKVGKRRLYNELCLWAWVKHIWGDKQLECTKAARASEVADRSALRSLAYKRGECGGCVASGECGPRDLQRLSKRSVALSKWLRLWKS